MAFEEELESLIKRTKKNDSNLSYTASYETINRNLEENKKYG